MDLLDCTAARNAEARRWEKGIAVSGRAAIEGGAKRQAEGGGAWEEGGSARENMAAEASPFGVRGEKNQILSGLCAFEKGERMQRHALKLTVPVAFEC